MQPVYLPGAAAAVRTLRGGLGAPGADALDPLIEELALESGTGSPGGEIGTVCSR